MAQTPRLGLVLLAAAQAQKHVTHNEALATLDGVVQASVVAMETASPPATATEGEAYLVAASPLSTGGFAGQALTLAFFINGSWRFLAPQNGWLVFVRNTASFVVYYGGAWHALEESMRMIANLQRFGLGTTADGFNRFAVKTNAGYFAALSSAESGTGDLRLTLNKIQSGNTASCLFQTNWSGRAEIGLTGDECWRVKVSSDGTTWQDVVVADPSSGAVRIDRLLSGRAQPRVQACLEAEFGDGGKQGLALNTTGSTPVTAIGFARGGTQIGSIVLTTSGVSYNTTSDYRLKMLLGPIEDPLKRLQQLHPYRFVFKSNPDKIDEGFLAHEVARILPQAVQGQKDAVHDDGSPLYQQLDRTALIPMLVAAVQDLAARVDFLDRQLGFVQNP